MSVYFNSRDQSARDHARGSGRPWTTAEVAAANTRKYWTRPIEEACRKAAEETRATEEEAARVALRTATVEVDYDPTHALLQEMYGDLPLLRPAEIINPWCRNVVRQKAQVAFRCVQYPWEAVRTLQTLMDRMRVDRVRPALFEELICYDRHQRRGRPDHPRFGTIGSLWDADGVEFMPGVEDRKLGFWRLSGLLGNSSWPKSNEAPNWLFLVVDQK